MASDAADHRPFTAYLACTEGEKLEVIIDNSEPVEISCEGTRHEISGIQKVALTGGAKIKISSSKQTGS